MRPKQLVNNSNMAAAHREVQQAQQKADAYKLAVIKAEGQLKEATTKLAWLEGADPQTFGNYQNHDSSLYMCYDSDDSATSHELGVRYKHLVSRYEALKGKALTKIKALTSAKQDADDKLRRYQEQLEDLEDVEHNAQFYRP